MSNGGYKGSTPARKTSPEQYPGVWELTEQFQAQADGNWPFQDTDCAPKSLKFDGNNAKLSRTPALSGSSSVFTLSCWVKRTLATSYDELLSIDGEFGIRFTNTNKLHVDLYAPDGSSWAVIADSKAIFRDPTAWYSIILVLDSSAGTTNADRLKLWVNGQPSEFDFSTFWGGLITGNIAKLHTVVEHTIGMRGSSLSGDFLIADYHFIDSQALEPTDFGFFDGQGIWQPKRFTGDYGLKTVTFTGVTTGGTQFEGPYSNIFDGNPASRVLTYTTTSTKLTLDSPPAWTNKIEIRALRYGGVFEINGVDISGLGWGTTAEYLDATSLLGSSGTLQTIEVGDDAANYVALYSIKLDGVELIQPTSGANNSFHLDFSEGTSDRSAKDTSGLGNHWTSNNVHIPSTETATYYTTSTLCHTLADVLTFGTNRGQSALTLSAEEYVYIVTGKGGADGQLAHGTGATWELGYVFANLSPASGYEWTYTGGYGNAEAALQYWRNEGTAAGGGENAYTYAADIPMYLFSDTRHSVTGAGYQPAADSSFASGTSFPALVNTTNNNPITGDTSVDSPVNGNQTDPSGLGGIIQGNYAVLNPLDKTSGITLSDGNLKATGQANGSDRVRGTIAIPRSGKWYFEFTLSSAFYGYIGISNIDGTKLVGRNEDGRKYTEAGHVSTPFASITAGDVVGVALDNNTTLTFYKNGVAESTTVTVDSNTDYFAMANFYNAIYIFNSGQRAFAHPLAGYKSLCTSNLPEPSIPVPSQYFDTKLWTGNSSTQTISGYGFSPDFAWIKVTSETGRSHFLFDTIRGATNVLKSDAPDVEQAYSTSLTDFNSDGFDLGAWANVNNSTKTIVGWAWDAGEATTTIAAGGLNSSVYDLRTLWRNALSGSIYSGQSAATLFNNSAQGIHAASGNSITFTTPSGYALSGTLEVHMARGTGASAAYGTYDVKVNGTSVFDNSKFPYNTNAIVNLGTFSNITSIEWGYGGNSSNDWIQFNDIRVNGKELVDSDFTPSNVPSIASTVRSSPESGFSIVTYTGGSSTPANSDSGDSFGHGLGASPKLVICKKRTGGNSWPVYHASTALGALVLDGDNAIDTASYLFAQKHPTSSVVYLGNNPEINNSSDNYVAYCFAPVEGYSAFGSYTGSSAFPFVYTGFKTRWVMMKVASPNHAGSWVMYDTTRDTASSGEGWLYANSTSSEQAAATYAVHTTSNGFRLAGTSNENNGSGRTYIYAAFAESPFKNARAR